MAVGDHIRNPETLRDIEFTAPTGGVTRGVLYLVEDTWAVAYEDADAGDAVVGHYYCDKIVVAKTAGAAINVGDKVYLDSGTKSVSATQGTGDVAIGTCIEAAESADTTVMIDLDGRGI